MLLVFLIFIGGITLISIIWNLSKTKKNTFLILEDPFELLNKTNNSNIVINWKRLDFYLNLFLKDIERIEVYVNFMKINRIQKIKIEKNKNQYIFEYFDKVFVIEEGFIKSTNLRPSKINQILLLWIKYFEYEH